MNNMKIICIAGHCGSGKTTSIKIMFQYLPNSIVIRGDKYLSAALLKHGNTFEEIYKIPFDTEQPLKCWLNTHDNASLENADTYFRFFHTFVPTLEKLIEIAILENKKKYSYILVEYVTLPMFKIWNDADYRIMINSNKELRALKLHERAIANNKMSHNENSTKIRENILSKIIDNANEINYIIENKYDEKLERDLVILCNNLTLTK